jgi:hypothetical protein
MVTAHLPTDPVIDAVRRGLSNENRSPPDARAGGFVVFPDVSPCRGVRARLMRFKVVRPMKKGKTQNDRTHRGLFKRPAIWDHTSQHSSAVCLDAAFYVVLI